MSDPTQSAAVQTDDVDATPRAVLRELPLSCLQVAEGFSPRRQIVRDREFDALVASIRDRGVLQPIRVQDLGDGSYQVIAGHRRYFAAVDAAVMQLPCVVVPAGQRDDGEALVDALIENDLRAGLAGVDLALQGDAALVERAAEDLGDGALVPPLALLGGQALVVELPLHDLLLLAADVLVEDAPHDGGLGLVDDQAAVRGVVVAERARPAVVLPLARPALRHGGHPCADGVRLELGHGGQQRPEELPDRRAEVDHRLQAHHLHPGGRQALLHGDQVGEVAAQPVELRHHDAVEQPRLGVGQQPVAVLSLARHPRLAVLARRGPLLVADVLGDPAVLLVEAETLVGLTLRGHPDQARGPDGAAVV